MRRIDDFASQISSHFSPRHKRRLGGRRNYLSSGRTTRLMVESLEPRRLLAADLVISELMAINQSTLPDELGNFDDWIEIHNQGNTPVNLQGWYLTDDSSNLTRWQFPERILSPDEYLVVFASGDQVETPAIGGDITADGRVGLYDLATIQQNFATTSGATFSGGDLDGDGRVGRADVATILQSFGRSAPEVFHTNFKLSGGGEYLALVEPDGETLASEFDTYPQQIPDVSFGRTAGGDLLYFTDPTPGAANASGSQLDLVVISEFMAVNHETLPDEDGDFADWIEIYNAGSEEVNLNGWYLTDSPWDLQLWTFPNRSISPGEYLVVFASGNDRREAEGELHTNFKLSSDGEYLALVLPDGSTVTSQFNFPNQQTDISYGLSPDLSTQRFFATPTPGTANLEQFPSVSFSQGHGFYDERILIELSSDIVGAQIRYTTDGREPTLGGGALYTEPIDVNTTTTLRAVAFTNDGRSDVTTQTYLFLDDVLTQTGEGQPNTWGFVTDYEMDPEIVTDPLYQQRLRDDLLSLPTISIVADLDDLFGIQQGIYAHPVETGSAWERAASVELIYPDTRPGFQATAQLTVEQNVGLLGPPATPKLPLRVRFDGPSEGGTTATGSIATDLFTDGRSQTLDSLVLLSGFEDAWIQPDGQRRGVAQYLRDQWLRDSLSAMGQPSIEGQFVHLYINGLYWGLYNAAVAPTAYNFAQLLGGEATEYDVLYGGEVVDGEADVYNTLIALANGDVADPVRYEQIRQLVDLENLIDFTILEQYATRQRESDEGWYAVRRRGEGQRFRFFVFDGEDSLLPPSGSPASAATTALDVSPTFLVSQLQANTEFRQLFADRLQMHLTGNGALSTGVAADRYTSYNVEGGIVGESARWGDYRRDAHALNSSDDQLYTLEDQWRSEQQRLVNDLFPFRSQQTIDEFRSRGLYPPLSPVAFSQSGGIISVGFELSMSAESGTVYFTTDGSDPRLSGGAISPAARRYRDAVPLTASTLVRARATDGQTWSALSETTLLFDTPPPLVVTEIMFHPVESTEQELAAGFDEDDDFEFIEIKNVGDEPIPLGGVAFASGIKFAFSDGDVATLAPGDHLLLVSNLEAFEFRYGEGFNIAGEYRGQLNNGGEGLTIAGSFGQTIVQIWFDDNDPLTDGAGFSLVNPSQSGDLYGGTYFFQDWQRSAFTLGSPGEDDPQITPGSVVISEVMAYGSDSDWIELNNTTGDIIDLSGWFLSDDPTNLTRWELQPGTQIFPGSYLQLRRGVDFFFGLGRSGDQVLLSSGRDGELGGYRQSVQFGVSEPDISYGRHVVSTGEVQFVPLGSATPGAVNGPPLVGPVVISEIMYRPTDGGVEFIELFNPTTEDVLLTDWRLAGIAFSFPELPILAGGFVVVSQIDPEIFRSQYSLPEEVVIVGPFPTGEILNSGGEKITLKRPAEGGGTVASDWVEYDDEAPWSMLADGRGASLVRLAADSYGNDPVNWSAGESTPGAANLPIGITPQAFPYEEGFEGQSLLSLEGWQFAVTQTGRWRVTADSDPYEGAFHLVADQTDGQRSSQEAVLLVDLSAQAGAANLALDFRVKQLRAAGSDATARVEISGDGASWSLLADLSQATEQVTQYALDLDYAMARAGLTANETLWIRFSHEGESVEDVMTLDAVRVTQDDFFPPNVIGQTPTFAKGGPLSGIEVTFDDPIDPATFTSEDVAFVAPDGAVFVPQTITSITPFTWQIDFAPYTLSGTYRVSIGPDIADSSGNLMNQGGAAVGGQTSGERNAYSGTFQFGRPTAQGYPATEDFESGDIASLPGWSFATGGSGTWQVTSAGNPQQEPFHLRASQVTSGESMQQAVLVVDLSDLTEPDDLSLDFWMRRAGHSGGNFTTLSVSGNGQDWSFVYAMAPPLGEQTHFAFDLDEALSVAGVTPDQDVYLRFQHVGRFANDEMVLDSVRIGNADLWGPAVTSQSVTTMSSEPLASIDITFDEPINLQTFTASDVQIVGPLGMPVPLSGDPTDSGDGQTFTLFFASLQTLTGSYRLTIGPEIQDAAGNAMNQDGDPNNGESNGNDSYRSSFQIGPSVAQSFPHVEGFESGDPAILAGWDFSVTASGTWEVSEAGKPQSGFYHLLAGQTDVGRSTQNAVLTLDLSDPSIPQEIYLDFWARRLGNNLTLANEGRLFVSGDGVDWTWIATLNPSTNDTYFAFDLAGKLASAGIERDADVYLQFTHIGNVAGAGMALDQIRVSDIDPFGPRIIAQTQLVEEGEMAWFDVTFDEPIDAATFTPQDVRISTPGSEANVLSITATDDVTFTVTINRPALADIYDVLIGPDINNLDGIPMNQDGDAINGESGPSGDAYRGTLLVSLQPQTLDFFEGFESGSLSTLSGWLFHSINEYGTRAGGTWTVGSDYDPTEGSYQLVTTQFADCWSQHFGILAIDVSEQAGADDLVLDFYMQRDATSVEKSQYGARNMGKLLVSGDGGVFTQVASNAALLNGDGAQRFVDLDEDGTLDLVPAFQTRTRYTLDLDQLLADAGIAVDGVVYLDFHRLAFWSSDILTFDAISIYRDGSAAPSAASRLAAVDLAIVQRTDEAPVKVASPRTRTLERGREGTRKKLSSFTPARYDSAINEVARGKAFDLRAVRSGGASRALRRSLFDQNPTL